ncbi:pentatricopeptide repeat-containing protein At5g66520-like [Euphorbia lathyris]|uniref:pentatricopeptide repeat-containing protein At5g66520-like n=1 Tax=Euphorbia lathyris TaxID=212925 RepID=UPI003313888F
MLKDCVFAASSPPISTPNLGFLQKCSTMDQLKQYHSQIIRIGLSTNNNVMTQLLNFCSLHRNGDLAYAIKVFEKIPNPDTFIYNTLIKSYLQYHLPADCVLLYSQMLENSVTPNSFTFPLVIRACFLSDCIEEGKQIHAHILKLGFGVHDVCLNNLIYMYAKFRALEDARRVFDKMPERNSVSCTSMISGYSQWGFIDEAFEVFQLIWESEPELERNSASWNAMIAAYVKNNKFHEAFDLFDQMRGEKVKLDKFIAATMLSACSGLGSLEKGKWIHGYIEKNGIEIDSKLATSIIDMYCKCGNLDKAFEVFRNSGRKRVSSWNSMIGGFAIHGKAEEAIKLFREMERDMVVPDKITFVNLLTACAHSGLVNEGRYYFDYMTRVHRIEPTTEHFGCIVDLLGRAGMIEEARRMLNTMPMKPDATVLGALLGACKNNNRNIEVGEEIGRKLIELEPENSGRYVLLANLYANACKWEDVGNVRKLMNDRGVKKSPGCSLIELGGSVNEFVSGGRNHPESKQVYDQVDEMLECIRAVGYLPDTSQVLHEADEEKKEKSLRYHSEKLAIAFGLLNAETAETLRISKNLRICKDCHQASKLISKVFNRKIVIRDRRRFHHFEKGHCSCNDYW